MKPPEQESDQSDPTCESPRDLSTDSTDLSHLPDTNTRPVATAVLLERLRLQRLWLAVESSTSSEYHRAMSRFRRALGLEAT